MVDLPGVGSNLQDHLEVYIQYASKQPVSIAPWMKHCHKPRIGAEWMFLRRGVGASNHFEAGGFLRSNDSVDYPNLMFHFLPIAIRYDGSQPASEHGYQVHIGSRQPARTRHRGLRVVDASAMPYIPNGNIYAPVMMVAEKAADLILGNEPLAAATEVPFYRYRRNTPLYPPGDPRNGHIRQNDEVS